MTTQPKTILVGAVAYHPRVVTVWEGFRDYFRRGHLDVDYVLFSNYERQIDALLLGEIDIAWNTNTAYVSAEHQIGGSAQVLGMRDVDASYATVLVVRGGGNESKNIAQLAGNVLALGSRDSGHAAILPLHYLGRQGVDLGRVNLLRFDTDLGKHGDTGDSEARVLKAVSSGDAWAGAVGDATWLISKAQGNSDTEGLEVIWRSPTYYHCSFTARPDFSADLAGRWLELLLGMDYGDASLRHYMDLEGVKRWLPGDKAGYRDLTEAMRRQGYLD
jgi:ABC-type phosphate/phosphonate transport system substrate-binding protein